MTKPKRKLKPWQVVVIGVATATIIISVNTAESVSKLFVNGKEVTTQEAKKAGTYAGGELFLPLNDTVKGMGDTSSTAGSLGATVNTKDGSYTFATNRSTAMKGDNFVPIATKTVNGVTVPEQVYPFIQGGTFMLPERAYEEILKYPVESEKKADGLQVYVGKKPAVTPPKEDPKPEPKPDPKPAPSPVKENPQYPFPDGWTAPSIGSVKTSGDMAKDATTLKNKLGFQDVSSSHATFYPDGGNAAISVSKFPDQQFEAYIMLNFWYEGNSPVQGANKVPYITKELLNFYNVPQAYDILEAGYMKGDISQANKMLTFNNRQVEVFAGPSYVAVTIGKPGKKYDNGWQLIN